MPGRYYKKGRKKIPLDLKQVELLSSLGCTDNEIAVHLGVSAPTFQRRKYEGTLDEALKRGKVALQVSLRRWQVMAAKKGNIAMLIFLGKNLLHQSDRQIEQIVITDEMLDEEILRLEDEKRKREERGKRKRESS